MAAQIAASANGSGSSIVGAAGFGSSSIAQTLGGNGNEFNFSAPEVTPEMIEAIRNGQDAWITDIDILNKKNLTTKQTPLSLVNSLQTKWAEGGPMINSTECWETKDPETQRSIWHYRVGIYSQAKAGEATTQVTSGILLGEATDGSKQKARHLSSQDFLARLFPGMTWNTLIDVILAKKGQTLQALLKERNAILLGINDEEEEKAEAKEEKSEAKQEEKEEKEEKKEEVKMEQQ